MKANKKSFRDIERQVNNLKNYLLDTYGYDYANPKSRNYNAHAAAELAVINGLMRRYTFSINDAEGFTKYTLISGKPHRMTYAEAVAKDSGLIYHPIKSYIKKYPREIYAK